MGISSVLRSINHNSLYYSLVSLYLMLITTFVLMIAFKKPSPQEHKRAEDTLEQVQHYFAQPFGNLSGGVRIFHELKEESHHISHGVLDQKITQLFTDTNHHLEFYTPNTQALWLPLDAVYNPHTDNLTPKFNTFLQYSLSLLVQYPALHIDVILHLPTQQSITTLGLPAYACLKRLTERSAYPQKHIRLGLHPARGEALTPFAEVIIEWIT